MKVVLHAIDQHKERFAQRGFFQRLEGIGTLDEATAFIPRLTFFVLTFQDMLRAIEKGIRDPKLRAIARQHRVEDAGHDRWFLRDVKSLGVAVDLETMFGPPHVRTRDTSYALMAEILHARSDLERIILLHVLEATGDAFFSRVPGFFQRAGYRKPLAYFSTKHHEVETAHEVFGEANSNFIAEVLLDEEQRYRALALVERCFRFMSCMVDDFDASMQRAIAAEPPLSHTSSELPL